MNQVLIIARTRMKDRRICVGAIEMRTGRLLRLLATTGVHFLESAAFQPGDVWGATYRDHPQRTPPHVEDVRLVGARKTATRIDVRQWLLDHPEIVPLWRSFPGDLYDGALLFSSRAQAGGTPRAAYVERGSRLPSGSLGIWQTDRPLVRREVRRDGRTSYRYDCLGQHDDDLPMSLPLAGFGPAPLIVPPGSIVSLALARWWTPGDGHRIPERCYVQLCDILDVAPPAVASATPGTEVADEAPF